MTGGTLHSIVFPLVFLVPLVSPCISSTTCITRPNLQPSEMSARTWEVMCYVWRRAYYHNKQTEPDGRRMDDTIYVTGSDASYFRKKYVHRFSTNLLQFQFQDQTMLLTEWICKMNSNNAWDNDQSMKPQKNFLQCEIWGGCIDKVDAGGREVETRSHDAWRHTSFVRYLVFSVTNKQTNAKTKNECKNRVSFFSSPPHSLLLLFQILHFKIEKKGKSSEVKFFPPTDSAVQLDDRATSAAKHQYISWTELHFYGDFDNFKSFSNRGPTPFRSGVEISTCISTVFGRAVAQR